MESQGIDDVELHEYGQTLGADIGAESEMRWVVEEAFNARLPASWTEHQDGEGRVYFFQESSNQSSWEHPLDGVYRELIGLVKQVIADFGLAADTENARLAIVQDHLTKVHQQAVERLEGWSGPYTAEAGEYYYNAALSLSTWESPLLEWEQELTLRHAVLCKCLLPDPPDALADNGNSPRELLLTSLKLPLSTIKRDVNSEGQPDTPSARSFHTPRSAESARSQRSGRISQQNNLARVEERRASSRGVGEDDGENEFTFGGTNQGAASVLGQHKAALAALSAQRK